MKKNVSAYFKKIFIYEFDLTSVIKFLRKNNNREKDNVKIAWTFFILLITSVISNESEGIVSEAVSSMYNVFNKSKDLLLESNETSLVSDVILKIINLKIRPILTKSRHLPLKEVNGIKLIDDEKLTKNQINHFWSSMNDLKKELVEDKYLRFIALISLSDLTNDDIIKLINYNNKNIENEKEKEIDKNINQGIKEILKEE